MMTRLSLLAARLSLLAARLGRRVRATEELHLQHPQHPPKYINLSIHARVRGLYKNTPVLGVEGVTVFKGRSRGLFFGGSGCAPVAGKPASEGQRADSPSFMVARAPAVFQKL